MVGVTLMTSFLAIVVCGIAIIQGIRYVMVHDPEENVISNWILEATNDKAFAERMGAKIGATMITLQVKILDIIWSSIAKKITDNENHKTESRY